RRAGEGTGISGMQVVRDDRPPVVVDNFRDDRPQVAQQLGDVRFSASGFLVGFDTTEWTRGEHTTQLQARATCRWVDAVRRVTITGSTGRTDPGQFWRPGGVAIDGQGNVYVADTEHHRIQKLSAQG